MGTQGEARSLAQRRSRAVSTCGYDDIAVTGNGRSNALFKCHALICVNPRRVTSQLELGPEGTS